MLGFGAGSFLGMRCVSLEHIDGLLAGVLGWEGAKLTGFRGG